jgi:hypothetical protein
MDNTDKAPHHTDDYFSTGRYHVSEDNDEEQLLEISEQKIDSPPNARHSSSVSFADLEAEELQFTRLDRARHLISRILYSKFYFAFYFLIIALSLFLLVWNFVKFWDHPRDVWYIILEGFVTFSLVVDVVARIFVEGKLYFGKCVNWLDLFLTTFCVASFILYMVSVHGSLSEQLGQNFDVVIIILRFIAQVPRMILFVRNQRKRQRITSRRFVDLNNVSSVDLNLDFTLGNSQPEHKDNLDTPTVVSDERKSNSYVTLV